MSDARSQAIAQVSSIVEMVAALRVDFDRLEELREERDSFASDYTPDYEGRTRWAEENPRDAEELEELEDAAGEYESNEEARERIQEDPLSIEVRSGWASPGETLTPDEFRIVLCTGGPHVELVGELDEYAEPSRVRVLFRGWGESGELFDFERETVLDYCRQFYFGA